MRAALACVIVTAAAALADEPKAKFKPSEEEQAVLDRTNEERKAAGLPALAASEKLFEAARGHAKNMAKQDRLEHTLDGKTFADRITAAGYTYSAAAENIGAKYATAKDAVKGWMESPPHKENLLSKSYTEIGIGVATNDKGEKYWVQVFAAPRKK